MTQEARPVSAQGKPDALISYSSHDEETAERLQKALQEKGVDVWRDKTNLTIGDSITTDISNAVEEIEFFIILISRHSLRSRWVTHELGIAASRQILGEKKILPVRLDDSKLPAVLADMVAADLRDKADFGNVVNDLHKAIVDQRVDIISADKPDSFALDQTLKKGLLRAMLSRNPTVLREYIGRLKQFADILLDGNDPGEADVREVLAEFSALRTMYIRMRWFRHIRNSLAIFTVSIVLLILIVAFLRKSYLPPMLQLAQDEMDRGQYDLAGIRLENLDAFTKWHLLTDIRVKMLRLRGDCARQHEQQDTAKKYYSDAWELLQLTDVFEVAEDHELVKRARDAYEQTRGKKKRQELAHILRGRAELRARKRAGSSYTEELFLLAMDFFRDLKDRNGEARVRLMLSDEYNRLPGQCKKALETLEEVDTRKISRLLQARVYWQRAMNLQEAECKNHSESMNLFSKALRCFISADPRTDEEVLNDEELVEFFTPDHPAAPLATSITADLLYWQADQADDGGACDRLSKFKSAVKPEVDIRAAAMFARARAKCKQKEQDFGMVKCILHNALDRLPADEGEVKRNVLDIDIDLRMDLQYCYIAAARFETGQGDCSQALRSIAKAAECGDAVLSAMKIIAPVDGKRHERYNLWERYRGYVETLRKEWRQECTAGK